MNKFIEALILEVQKRPLLWNRQDDQYKNRAAMEREWDILANLFGRDKESVRRKWRNLRDVFKRELKKVHIPHENPPEPLIRYYRGRWLYFELMQFYASTLSTSQIRNHSPDICGMSECEIKEITDFEDHVYDSDGEGGNESIDNARCFMESLVVVKTEIPDDIETVYIDSQASTSNNNRKRTFSETDHCYTSTARDESAKLNKDKDEIDDDLHFAKSLVPYLKKLSPIRKLLVRNEIQNLLLREIMCDGCCQRKS